MSSKSKGRDFEDKFVQTINSGAFFHDADAVSSKNMIEIKFTEKKGFRLTTKILEKIWSQSFDRNKLPIMGIGIQDNEKKCVWMLKVDICKQMI